MSTSPIRSQLRKGEMVDALAKAHPLSVQHCCCVLVDYHPYPSDDPPHIKYTTPLKQGDFVHFKTKYNSDWWIGRVVGHETGMTFVPSEEKLSAIIQERGEGAIGSDKVAVYKQAPVMRPIVLVGPSRKDSELTKLLHKPLVSYMREKFISRLVTIKPDWSFNDELMDKQIKQLEGEVYAAASTMNIVFLDCDANFPGDFDNTNLHPHFVYVKVARQQVLQTLLKQLTVGSRDRMSLLNDARHLFENSDQCSLTISESNVDDACLSLELFLESYWAATQSVVLMDTLKPSHASATDL